MNDAVTYLAELNEPWSIEHKPYTGHPNAGRNALGYGKRIPTGWIVRLRNRQYRVYCCCFSNCGTCYIRTKDHPFLVVRDADIQATL